MAGKHANLLQGGNVPKLHGGVPTPGGYHLSIRTERHAVNRCGMTILDDQLRSRRLRRERDDGNHHSADSKTNAQGLVLLTVSTCVAVDQSVGAMFWGVRVPAIADRKSCCKGVLAMTSLVASPLKSTLERVTTSL